jgi:hypothetical protein
MLKHTNPFYTISEAIGVLINHDADPYKGKPTIESSEGATYAYWQEHILSVKANRIYDDHLNHHFEVEIHVDREGLDALVAMTGMNVLREHHSEGYDQLTLHPGSLLKIFTLEFKGAII